MASIEITDDNGPSTFQEREGSREESSESTEVDPSASRNIEITGGHYKNPNFGTIYSYHVMRSGSQQSNEEMYQPTNAIAENRGGHQARAPMVPPQNPISGNEGTSKRLTDSIWVYPNKPLTNKGNVFAGYQKTGMFENDDVAVKRFPFNKKREREAKNLRKLKFHPNVVQIFYADIIEGSIARDIFIVMEQCQTINLDTFYEKRRANKMPFNTQQALDFSYQVIEGISHIHEKKIIHRDLKPTSVLFSLDGKTVKIIDFGLSKELAEGRTVMSISTKLGEDGYRAPETYEKNEINQQSDIFSLALILYHLWSNGRHPFGEDSAIWCYNIKKKIAPDLSKLLVPDKGKASDLQRHMLENRPCARYKIGQVRQHEYIRQGIECTILTNMVESCYGALQLSEGWSLGFGCKMYSRIENGPQEFQGRVKFQLVFIPQAELKNIYPGMDREPDGFLAFPKEGYTKLVKKFKDDDKMGWIDISSDGIVEGVIVMLRPKDYEELVCIFFQNPEDLKSIFELSHHETTTTLEQPAHAPTNQSRSAEPVKAFQAVEQAKSLRQTKNTSSQSSESDRREPSANPNTLHMQQQQEDVEFNEAPTDEHEVNIYQPEFVSWWNYRK